MSEVRLVIREAECDWSGTIYGSFADRAIAALSADPITLDELADRHDAVRKAITELGLAVESVAGSNDEPYDAGLVVIDLVARLIMIESTYSSAGREGVVYYHSGDKCSDIAVSYHLADDWRFLSAWENWRYAGDFFRKGRAGKPVLDTRSVFYELPLCEFIAKECFAQFTRHREMESVSGACSTEPPQAVGLGLPPHEQQELLINGSSQIPQVTNASCAPLVDGSEPTSTSMTDPTRSGTPVYDTLKQIHIDWLMTPRDDLGGAYPREIALQRKEHLSWDIQDRWLQWTALHFCPRVLDESSHAFRYAGFGTHELVMYYDMIREMLWSCWEKLTALARSPEISQRPESMLAGDFIASEVPRLEGIRDAWLDSPNSETRGSAPRSIIHRERLRMPEVISGKEAMIDDDCPLCQMMGESTSPGLCGYDGSSMDDDFAFNISFRTREEWIEDQKKWEEFNKRFAAEWRERERLGVTSKTPHQDGSNAEWSKTFAVGDAAELPLGIRVFEIGSRLAELIVALRGPYDRESTPPETQSYIDQLNRDFGNLRDVLRTSNVSLAESLLTPVLDRFGQTLDEVLSARPDVSEKCEAVTEELEDLFITPSDEPDEPMWEADDDVPF